MKIRSSKDRIISIAIATAIISTCTIPNVIAESRNDINEPEQTISNSQEEVYITGEIAELRSKYSKTYEQSDGSRIAVMSAAPICFYDKENDTWEEYDNRLTFNEETETFVSEETGSDMQVSLPKNIDEQNNIEVEADGYTVSITPMEMKSLSSKKTNEKKRNRCAVPDWGFGSDVCWLQGRSKRNGAGSQSGRCGRKRKGKNQSDIYKK